MPVSVLGMFVCVCCSACACVICVCTTAHHGGAHLIWNHEHRGRYERHQFVNQQAEIHHNVAAPVLRRGQGLCGMSARTRRIIAHLHEQQHSGNPTDGANGHGPSKRPEIESLNCGLLIDRAENKLNHVRK